ncbi:hypothetical protein F66182_16619, partial [Fusarium sp. NRRL 66182]
MAEPTTPPGQMARSVPGPSPGHGYPAFSAGGGMSSHYASSMAATSHQPGSSFGPSRDEGLSPSEAELRRRTWHPSTYPRPATSGLTKYEESANTLRPAFGAGNTGGQTTRLPGIESFDKVVQGRPLTPPLRKPSPMQIDTPNRGPPYTPGFAGQVPSSRPPPAMSGL